MDKQIAASILGIENKVQIIKKILNKKIKWIHYDVMDGMFVPNKSLPLSEIEYILSNTPEHIVDIHLMVNDPYKYIIALQGKFTYLTFHYEAESIERIRKIMHNFADRFNIGLAINPKTNVEQIYEFLHDVSHILIMTVQAGKGGQSFNHDMLKKIKKIKSYLNKIKRPNVFIQVDGGINNQTGPLAVLAGATSLVSGSFLLKNLDNPQIINQIINEK